MSKKLALPKSIRVGPFDYAVRYTEAHSDDKLNVLGQCSPTRLSILIQQDMPPTRTAECVLHEVTHAIADCYALMDDDGKVAEERMAQVFGAGWAQVWRDNPKLLQWMQKALS